MRARGVAIAGLVLLLALATWLWWAGSTAATGLGAAAPRDNGVLAAFGPKATEELRLDRRAAADSGAVDAEKTDTRARHAADGLRRFCVQVVWPDGQPAAGAELRYWARRTAEQWRDDLAESESSHDVEAALSKTGSLLATDADGRVTFDAESDGMVCVRAGDHYAEADLPGVAESHLPMRLVLQRDVALQVEVVDDRGQPVADVAIEARCCFARRAVGENEEAYLELGATDERGVVTWPHLQVRAPLPGRAVVTWSCTVGCVANHLRAVRSEVRPAEVLAGSPIRLVVPTGGQVAVEVVDAGGRPFRNAPILVDAERQMDCSPTTPFGSRIAIFEQVPLGRRWQVEVSTENAGNFPIESVTTPLLGPSEPGEVVHTSIVVPRMLWHLMATLRCSDGRALEGTTIAAEATAVDAAGARATVRSTHGYLSGDRATIFVWTRPAQQLQDIVLIIIQPSLPAPLEFVVAHPLLWPANELGAFRVPAPTDEVDLATVRVRLGGAIITRDAAIQLHAMVGAKWEIVPFLARDAGDTRILRARQPAGKLYVSCDHSDAIQVAPRAIEPGAAVEFELSPCSDLIVPVHAPEVPGHMLQARVAALDGTYAEDETLAEQRWFRWQRLPPGRYRLAIQVAGGLVFTQELPPLAPGSNVWPATDTPLDLRLLARVLHLAVRDPEGRPLPDHQHLAVAAGSREVPEDLGNLLQATAWVPVDEPARDLLFAAPGFVPVRVLQPRRDVVVELPRATQLDIHESAGIGAEVTITYRRHALEDPLLFALDEVVAGRSLQFELDAGECTQLAFPPGTELGLCVQRAGAAATTQTIVVGATSPQRVDVR